MRKKELISEIEKTVAFRYLRPKRKEGFLKVVSVFSFLGISLGVAVLIIVMSVMNGFRTELVNKILGFNAHIVLKPYEKEIKNDYLKKIRSLSKNIKNIIYTINGEAILLKEDYTKGILVRSYSKKEFKKINLIQKNIIDGSIKNFDKGTISIGKDLAILLDIVVGDKITLMSSSSITTIFGSLPKQETFVVSSIFSSGLSDFDQNVIFMPMLDAFSLFDKDEKDMHLEIFLKNPENVDLIKNDIQNLSSDYFVYSWSDLNKSLFGALKIERNVMFIILSLIIIVGAFNIISGLTILSKNKTKEIAILRTIGVSRKSISKIFFLVGFSIGLFSYYIEEIRFILSNLFNITLFPEEIYFLSKMPSEINLFSISIICVSSLLITTFASIFPSLSASKLDPIKALKYE